MDVSYSTLRRKLASLGLWPRSTLARVTVYLVAADVLLFILGRLAGWLGISIGPTLLLWTPLLTFISCVLLLVLAFRWIRRKVMWRLRNRLIVTYVFIGVIPVVLLLSMAYIAANIFGGQFAVLLATTDIETQLREVDSANSELSAGLAARLARGELVAPALERFATEERHFPGRQVTVWYDGQSLVAPLPSTPLKPPPDVGDEFRTIAVQGGRLYLRAGRKLPVGRAGELAVISSVPLDGDLLNSTVARVGEVTLSAIVSSGRSRRSSIQEQGNRPAVSFNIGGSESAPHEQQVLVKGGTVPPPRNRWDIEVPFPGLLPVTDWNTGKTEQVGLAVNTRPSLLYQRLSATFGEQANVFITALIIIAVMLGIVELLSLIIGIRLTRTMTRSVNELYKATQHVNRGDFRHRIRVKAQDQLAALETSFNSMTESIEKLLAEQKEKQRIEHELAIAQEVQAQLFPQQVSDLPSLEVHGICRPARTVSGDYYDFLPLGADRVALAVGDISGKGISAALLMATIHSAVRAYSLERAPAQVAVAAGDPIGLARVPFAGTDGELSPATLMAMLNRQLYGSTPAEKYATMFLGIHHADTRRLTYCNAGHLPPVILGRDGALRRLECGGTVIGLFGGLTFDEATIELRPGDIMLAYSDGVTEPENEFGEFGEERLIELVRENRDLPLERISEAVLQAVTDWIGGAEQPDDITLVMARAR